ncbi:hypothetical protein HID58_033908, partial [Brassica napus]
SLAPFDTKDLNIYFHDFSETELRCAQGLNLWQNNSIEGYRKGKSRGGKQMRLLQVVVQLVCYICITMFNTCMRLLTLPVCFLVTLACNLLNTDRNKFNIQRRLK